MRKPFTYDIKYSYCLVTDIRITSTSILALAKGMLVGTLCTQRVQHEAIGRQQRVYTRLTRKRVMGVWRCDGVRVSGTVRRLLVPAWRGRSRCASTCRSRARARSPARGCAAGRTCGSRPPPRPSAPACARRRGTRCSARRAVAAPARSPPAATRRSSPDATAAYSGRARAFAAHARRVYYL